MEVDECPTLNTSYSLSPRHGTGAGRLLTDGAYFVAASGQNFMRISLMPHIPNQLVKRGVIDVVQRYGQLDRAQPGGEVPAGTAHAVE